MKRLFILSVLAFMAFLPCVAQGYAKAIEQDPARTAGTFYVYDSNALPAITAVPDGYKPVYISHFGRHGARYCTSEYENLHSWLSKAAGAGALTDAGKEFYERYEAYYGKVRYCKGNLSTIGKQQHRQIAGRMYERFPDVFDGPTHVQAVSTESPRVIMSMWSFLSALQAKDADIEFDADASAKYASWLQPTLKTNPYLVAGAFDVGKPAEKAFREYFDRTVPWKEIASRFFTDAGVLRSLLNITPTRFIDVLHGVVSSTCCLSEDRGCFDDVFSKEELACVWKGLSAKYFMDIARFEGSGNLILDYAAFTLDQIIESADADLASGSTQLRLRFGHDSGIAPLMVLLDADGCGRATSSFEESLEIFPSYNNPMGSSVQFVFYRNSSGDTLVKVLVNEREVTLPLEPVKGPCYRWGDFKAYYGRIVSASKAKIAALAGN